MVVKSNGGTCCAVLDRLDMLPVLSHVTSSLLRLSSCSQLKVVIFSGNFYFVV